MGGLGSILLLGLLQRPRTGARDSDAFQSISGPASWGTSILLNPVGAPLGRWSVTGLLGIGDADTFDWGGTIGALIGSVVVVAVASAIIRRSAPK
jgi:uncharacterized membrane protein YeaQ/YmgE (transglycosylase-associated protein family)